MRRARPGPLLLRLTVCADEGLGLASKGLGSLRGLRFYTSGAMGHSCEPL